MASSARSKPVSRAIHLPLGKRSYAETLSIQRRLHARRLLGEIPDLAITVEHEPVFTIGRSGSIANVIAHPAALKREGIEVVAVERGGDITYHGPGQLVCYPIVDLRDHGRDIKLYIDRLEGAAVETLAAFGIAGSHRDGYPGVWVDGRKVASIGVYVRRWVTMHGIAINVATDPSHFAMIKPCGLDVEAISISEILDRPVAMAEVTYVFVSRLAALFGWELEEGEVGSLLEKDEAEPARLD